MVVTLVYSRSHLLQAATNPVFKSYDIVAVQPMTDKVWEKCTKDLGADCMRVAETHPELDVDIITFDLTQRLPVQLKIPKVREAIKRGIYFEINYSAALIGMLGCANERC
jgi:ribonuclease P/MRP protein subunit RPP1